MKSGIFIFVFSMMLELSLLGQTMPNAIVNSGNNAGKSPSSPTNPPPIPSAPTGLSGSFDDSGNMNLSWTASTGATSYQVERETLSTGTWSSLGTATGTTYQDTRRSAGSGYHYRVSAINSRGSSAPSNEFPISSYAAIDLGQNFYPVGINNSAVVLGNFAVWSSGNITALLSYPGDGVQSSVTSIDDSNHIAGLITGYVYDSNGNMIGNNSAVGYWSSTTDVPLRIGLGSVEYPGACTGPAIISDQGFIVGRDEGSEVLQFAPSDAPPNLGYRLSNPSDVINLTGAAGTSSWCGYNFGTGTSTTSGPVINGTTYTTSPTLYPYAINDSNLVVGGDGPNAKLVQVSGSTLQITNLGSGVAKALNNHTTTGTPSPQIIGVDGQGNGTLWEKTNFDGSSSDTYIKKNLNDLLPPTSGWSLQSPTYSSPCVAINNSAAIVGTATYSQIPLTPTTHGVMLLPCEIVDKDKNTIAKLKVGKMMDTSELTGTDSSVVLDIDKDSDLFYVRMRGAAHFGAVSIEVTTTDNPDASYNDAGAEVDMQVDGNDLISKSMLLVSDDVDDDYEVDSIADNSKNDRTFKVQLGGNFQIKSIKLWGNEYQENLKVPVPVQKTVNIGVVILRLTAGGTPVISQADVERDLKIAQERYAQVGIKLTWSISFADPPSGVDLSDGLNEFSDPSAPSAEETALLSSLGTTTTSDLQIFYVNSLSNGSFGESFVEGFAPSALAANVIMSVARRLFTLPHELGHVLKSDVSHASNTYQLMRGGGTSATNTLGSSKRITTSEEATMQGSSHAK